LSAPDQPIKKRHPNYKGGRIIDPRGYALVYVGKKHHLADVRGYAYEHRIVAEKKLGRHLVKGEEVHHDKSNSDNSPDDLIICKNRAEHKALHRKRSDLRAPGAKNPKIKCACGCGCLLRKFDSINRPRRFMIGHARRKTHG
jgi:hypothetical protein